MCAWKYGPLWYRTLEKHWPTQGWEYVRKLQARIVKAQREGRNNKVKALQWMLTHSFYAKALAVKRVTTNKGKSTSGVDKITWSSPLAKAKAIFTLKRHGYKPQPLKRVNIKKKNEITPTRNTNDERPCDAGIVPNGTWPDSGNHWRQPFLRIPQTSLYTWCHRAMLHRSFSFGRSRMDSWGDIKGCFDHISHAWLINNIPMDKEILRKWLECGYVFNGELFPTEEEPHKVA